MNQNMVKVGIGYINKEISPKKYLRLLEIGIIILTVLLYVTIDNYIKTKDYVKVVAKITDKYERSGDSDNYENYILLDYEYNNRQYSNEQQVFFKFNKNIGEIVKISINPENPGEMKNSYMTNLFYIMDTMLLVWILGVGSAYKARRDLEMELDPDLVDKIKSYNAKAKE